MLETKNCVEFSEHDLDLIESALHTQEKILAVQSRASGNNTAKVRLNELKSVLRRVRRKNAKATQAPCRSGGGLGGFARALFG